MMCSWKRSLEVLCKSSAWDVLSSRVLAGVLVERKGVRPTIFSEWWGGTGRLMDGRKEMGKRVIELRVAWTSNKKGFLQDGGGKWRIRNIEIVS